jgi:cytochrome b561
MFLRAFLSLFNGNLKKEKGKKVIRDAVDSGMLFLAPFAIMMLLAVYYLNWTETRGFISAGIMAVGTASAIEMGRLKGKQEIRNTIAASGISFVFSFLWTLSYVYMAKAPGLIEGGAGFIGGLLSGGGAGL